MAGMKRVARVKAMFVATGFGSTLALGAYLYWSGGGSAGSVAQGSATYAAHCAGCHGANLEGQPEWQRRLPSGRWPAPPHDATGHTWHHADGLLFTIVKDGQKAVLGADYQTDMPAFAGVISDDAIRAVLAYIKSTWPLDQRAYQELMNRPAAERLQQL